MASLRCSIRDKTTGAPLDAKVHVLSSLGTFVSPSGAILKIGSGVPFFYAQGGFEVELPVGHADVIVERGTEFVPSRSTVRIPTEGMVELEVPLSRWTNLPDAGWYPGKHAPALRREGDAAGRASGLRRRSRGLQRHGDQRAPARPAAVCQQSIRAWSVQRIDDVPSRGRRGRGVEA